MKGYDFLGDVSFFCICLCFGSLIFLAYLVGDAFFLRHSSLQSITEKNAPVVSQHSVPFFTVI